MTDILSLASKFKENFFLYKKTFATAESCTGGLVSATITQIPGSSNWFDRGFVTYTNEAKHQMLGVELSTLEKYGAVSVQVARQMAQGVIKNSKANISVAITGIAGPDGGTIDKPVGTVCIAFASDDGIVIAKKHLFLGDREKIRYQSVQEALQGMLLLAQNKKLDDYS